LFFQFRDPYMLLLLLVVPLLFWRARRARNAGIKYSDIGLLKRKAASTWRIRCHQALPYLRGAVLSLLVVGLARPQAGTSSEEILTKGIDIVLTLDVSTSMKAEDFRPDNRLAVAKRVASDFIRGRKNDRIGLVVFAAKSFTQCPLTLDYGMLQQMLAQVNFGMIEDGTAIGSAIGTSINRLKDSKAKSKVIILLTDGVNNRGEIDPVTAAELAKSLGIKIYTIGAGTVGTAPYPVDDPVFGRRYVQVKVDLDEATLRKVAELTSGRYFRATSAEALKRIYDEISNLEKTEIKSRKHVNYRELFGWFVFPALGLFALETLLACGPARRNP